MLIGKLDGHVRVSGVVLFEQLQEGDILTLALFTQDVIELVDLFLAFLAQYQIVSRSLTIIVLSLLLIDCEHVLHHILVPLLMGVTLWKRIDQAFRI